MTLALLIMAVTGAWAAEKMVTINSSTMSSGAVTATGFNIFENYLYVSINPATITTSEGVITKLVIKKGALYGGGFTKDNVGVTPGTITYDTDEITVTDINAESVTLSRKGGDNWSTSSVDVYTDDPSEWPLTSQDGKTWTLDKMPANDIELQVEYEPTKVKLAANDKTMGTVEVGGESKVEWTADTWQGWTADNKTHTVDDITMTSSESAYILEITEAGDNLHSLFFYVSQENNNATVKFSTTGDPFSRIKFTMINDYVEDYLISNTNRWGGNPVIMPKDGWTFEGKSAVWEGEATKSLTLQSCTTYVSKITFFKGGVPDGVTVNGDGTFTVAKTATVTLTATPAEGYKFLYWEDDQNNTNPVREVTIESGEADKTYTAVFAEPTYNVTFVEGIEEADKWKAEPNAAAKNTEVKVTYSGAKKVLGMKVEKKSEAVMTTVTWNSTNVFNSAHENVELSKWYPTPLTFEGITISFSGTKASSFQAYDEDDHIGSLLCNGNNGDSFTFTTPSGKKFCKIEIINNGFIVFANYGDWTRDANNNKIVWSGTAANEVTLGSVNTSADNLNSIVFYLSE